ncbi:general secretion pathway protein E [Halomonas campaniensis]|uniref:General secretion pathway protein E n=1 Tax=Halomonas campaniensis TaxID=213554 RepID=A0A7W5K2G2_9GAMM|nr:ATPase, T2SS/T4P/T4SS family [Halomonas campaniensis]MBB3330626.1 general secretion pathway protein E [Halomonas campaniensis]
MSQQGTSMPPEAPAAPSLPGALLPYRLSRHSGVAIEWHPGGYGLVCREDADIASLLEVQRRHGPPLSVEWLTSGEFEGRLGRLHDDRRATTETLIDGLAEKVDLDSLMHDLPATEDLLDTESEAPVIRLINAIFSEALRLGASDIHIEPFENALTIRLRVDGTLRVALGPPRVLAPMLISRIKVMAKLDIAEKRQPQDGRIGARVAGRAVDIRVSTLPGIHGERVVMRLLDKQASLLELERIGMPAGVLADYRDALARPNGILLNTGPTGSGKTTTLYASLAHLNDSRRSILTVEDPVEYAIPGIGQTPVNPQAGLTFAHGLRAILRQDPDVIMIGEIRDVETAAIAVQASLTGHLVLSTLHTNSALGAIVRLRDMGIEPYLLANSLKGVMAQRLVRRLCPACRRWRAPTAAEARWIPGVEGLDQVADAVGCEHCEQAGYRGRLGLYEFIAIDETLAGMIHDRLPEPELARHAFARHASLNAAALAPLTSGETSVEEVVRALHH